VESGKSPEFRLGPNNLTTDSSILTAVGNDYGFDQIFAQQVQALGRPGDVAIGISTSGNSPNVTGAIKQAAQQDLKTIGLTGKDGGSLAQGCRCFNYHCLDQRRQGAGMSHYHRTYPVRTSGERAIVVRSSISLVI